MASDLQYSYRRGEKASAVAPRGKKITDPQTDELIIRRTFTLWSTLKFKAGFQAHTDMDWCDKKSGRGSTLSVQNWA